MARFSNTPQLARKAPTSIGPTPQRIPTFEGGVGFKPSDPHVELFNAAVSGMLADQFYESGDQRVERLVALVGQCDPAWLREFIPWLRAGAHLRSAPIVLAAEYARNKFPQARYVVGTSMQRADEPAEMLGYWFGRYGRNLPASVKRGVADAVQRLYTERALLRYDGQSKSFRFGDVIEIVHPKPEGFSNQSHLFKFALDRRRHDAVAHPGELPRVSKTLHLDTIPQDSRNAGKLGRLLMDPQIEFSWERAASWLGGPMTKEAWEAVLPSMGYFALLRNLNNFERNGVDPTKVIERLTDRDAIKGSRVMPFRFQTAYKNLETDRYKQAVADAADVALENLPWFPNSTLIMVDCSGSMGTPVGAGKSRSPLRLSELAGFFAEAVARRCDNTQIVTYDSMILDSYIPKRHASVLLAAAHPRYFPRGGTETWRCLRQAYRDHARVIVITDEQTLGVDDGTIKAPIITWNLAGYQAHHAAHNSRTRLFVGGYSDSVLQTLPAVISQASTGLWPWQDAG